MLLGAQAQHRNHARVLTGGGMAGRMIAIGDIHGCLTALATLIDAIEPGPEDTLVTLGDHIDRGPDTSGVVDRLIALAETCQLIPLMGDHEELLVDALSDITARRRWLSCGGAKTLQSYGWFPGGPRRALTDWIPEQHRKFVAGCRPYHETGSHLFVHAGFLPELPMDKQPGQALRWRVTDRATATPHQSGKVAVVGHTPQLAGEVLDLGFLVCVDTNCARGGWLTALDMNTGRIWQANQRGKLRTAGAKR
jgi:serine/threonine protein phosphatase 1